MNIFRRITDLLDANVNALIDKVEDPEIMLDKFLSDMDEDYRETQAMVAKTIAARNLTQKRYDDAQEEVDKWYKNAMLAVEKGNDELAKKALKEQTNFEHKRDSLKPELENQAAEVENLKELLSKLEDKISEAKSKKDILITKATNAEAKKKLAEFTSNISSSDSIEGFMRMEEKVNEIVAQADALSELNGQSLEAQFDSLKDNDEDPLDDKLAKLKASMGK